MLNGTEIRPFRHKILQPSRVPTHGLLTHLHIGAMCTFQFCYECGADHKKILTGDNSLHKPDCRFHPNQQTEEEYDAEVADSD